MTKYGRWTALILMGSFLAGCATKGSVCAGWQPIRPTKADVAAMSVETKRDVVTHNTGGEDRGCWKP
jgi:hypothetical protein